MIRAAKLTVSRPHYAFKPDTWHITEHGWRIVDAVWFKRKQGILTATVSELTDAAAAFARAAREAGQA